MPGCPMEMEHKPSALCKAHCEQTPQSSETGTVVVPWFIAISCITLSYPEEEQRPFSFENYASPRWMASSSPPLRIQFQVFRI